MNDKNWTSSSYNEYHGNEFKIRNFNLYCNILGSTQLRKFPYSSNSKWEMQIYRTVTVKNSGHFDESFISKLIDMKSSSSIRSKFFINLYIYDLHTSLKKLVPRKMFVSISKNKRHLRISLSKIIFAIYVVVLYQFIMKCTIYW